MGLVVGQSGNLEIKALMLKMRLQASYIIYFFNYVPYLTS